MARVARGVARYLASPDRAAPVEQGRRGGGAVRCDPFGRSRLARHRARAGDGQGRASARVLRPGQYRCRGAEGRRRDCRSRSEEHTSELQSLMRISYAVFCLKKKNKHQTNKIVVVNI